MAALLMLFILASGCSTLRSDRSGPNISDITTSSKVVVISDCQDDSVTVSARVTDESNIEKVLLWYRVNSDRPFAFTDMDLQGDVYTATLKGSALQGQSYGDLEFYVSAQDGEGNTSESPHETSVQFLPCVSN
jgi:hypothetical protein